MRKRVLCQDMLNELRVWISALKRSLSFSVSWRLADSALGFCFCSTRLEKPNPPLRLLLVVGQQHRVLLPPPVNELRP
jgi:hypothetical protein